MIIPCCDFAVKHPIAKFNMVVLKSFGVNGRNNVGAMNMLGIFFHFDHFCFIAETLN